MKGEALRLFHHRGPKGLWDTPCSQPDPGPDSKSARLKKLSPFKGKKVRELDLDADEIQPALVHT